MVVGYGVSNWQIKIGDIDLDRKMLHVREGKGRKDRYVPIGNHLCRGLKTFLEAAPPYIWLFNGKNNTGQLQQFTGAGVRWVVKEAARKSGIKKHITSHVLRLTYATHLLGMGLDIMTLKDLLGHSDINTTLVYLHIARLGRGRAFSPMDKLYPEKDK